MKTPSQMLGQIQTRGEFRELNALAERESCSADRKASISPDSPIWDAWEAIKAFYPGSTANWDSEPPMMWAHVLFDLNLEQLANGVKNLIHHRDAKGANDFPPNAGQFRDLCLTNFDWERRAHKICDVGGIEDLTAKETRIKQGLTELQKLRQEVGL